MNTSTLHLTNHRAGFEPGETVVTRHDADDDPVGLGVSVLRLRAGERLEQVAMVETAWLLMEGHVLGIAGGRAYLAAYALGFGASGLTFYDAEVVRFFSPRAAGHDAIFVTALGRSAPVHDRVLLSTPTPAPPRRP